MAQYICTGVSTASSHIDATASVDVTRGSLRPLHEIDRFFPRSLVLLCFDSGAASSGFAQPPPNRLLTSRATVRRERSILISRRSSLCPRANSRASYSSVDVATHCPPSFGFFGFLFGSAQRSYLIGPDIELRARSPRSCFAQAQIRSPLVISRRSLL